MSTRSYCLDIWKGDWGLPSIDIHCLQILTYARINGIPLTLNATCNPFKTPRNRLPVLRSDVYVVDSTQDMIQLFRKRKDSPDFLPSAKEYAEVVSYQYMLDETFYPALQFVWWIDRKNLTDLIRPWYSQAVPFPLNFFYPSTYEKQARALMESLFPNEEIISAIESKVYSEAQKCMTLLSTRLGDSEYFLGSKPTSLDALVYAYLAPLLKAPLPNPALQNHLKACTNLVKFVSRISQRYFEYDYQEYEKLKSMKNNENFPRRDSENDFLYKKRDQVLAGVVATLAMITYALVTGIVRVRFQ